MDHLGHAWRELGEVPSVLEAVAPFTMELSVVPAQVAHTVRSRAEALGVSLAEALDSCGIMAAELFLLEDKTLLVNEVAPRPHNSGHFTLGACATSQFEQRLRAICGLPLGDPSLLRPVVMVNLLGVLWRNGPPPWDRLLAHPQVRLHLYGKDQVRPGRTMGHFLFLDEDGDRALCQAESLLQCLTHDKHTERCLTTESQTGHDPQTPPSRMGVRA